MANAEASDAGLSVEVAWSPAPREMRFARLSLRVGATLADALAATGWAEFAAARGGDDAFDHAGFATAIWGRSRPLAHVLRDGDRIEVLRPLVVAPMDARRVRLDAAGGVKALRQRALRAQAQKRSG